jgi:hypothetical protein
MTREHLHNVYYKLQSAAYALVKGPSTGRMVAFAALEFLKAGALVEKPEPRGHQHHEYEQYSLAVNTAAVAYFHTLRFSSPASDAEITRVSSFLKYAKYHAPQNGDVEVAYDMLIFGKTTSGLFRKKTRYALDTDEMLGVQALYAAAPIWTPGSH